MELSLFSRHDETRWEIAPHGKMRVPAVIYASEELIRTMDHKVYEQVTNVATLPGIVGRLRELSPFHSLREIEAFGA